MDKLRELGNWLFSAGLKREALDLKRLCKEAATPINIKQLKEWLDGDYSKLSFDKLFDGKLRIAIPLKTKQEAELSEVLRPLVEAGWRPAGDGALFEIRKIEHKARRLGGEEYTEEVDVADFKVAKSKMKTIPSGPRAGEVVETKKVLSLSKAIRMTSEEAFLWWQENQAEYSKDYNWKQVEAVFDKNASLDGSSIIISRDPIDVLRMSDHKNIASCHSQGGLYFECAVAESRGTGLIAYLVDNSDLEKLLSSGLRDYETGAYPASEERFELADFDKKEIFRDPERNISGIIPKSRVRLRKYMNEELNYEFAAPESRTYGPHPPGFVEAVRSWAWDQQKELFKGDEDLPDQTWLQMHGGSYRDTSDGVILNSFFEQGGFATNYSGNVKTVSENEMDTYSMWDAEVQEVVTRANSELKHTAFYAEVEGEIEDPYIYTSASISLQIPYDLPENPSRELPSGDAWSWDSSIQSNFRSMLDHPEGTVEEYGIDEDKRIIFGSININCDDCNNPDEVSAFLDFLIRDVDRGYDEYVEKVRRKFVEEGYISEIEFDRAGSRLSDADLQNLYFVGSLEDNDGEIMVSLKPEEAIKIAIPKEIEASDLPGILGATPHHFTHMKYILGDEYKAAVLKRLEKIAKQSLRQLYFDFGDGWTPPESEVFSLEQITKSFEISTSIYSGVSSKIFDSINLHFSLKIGSKDSPEHVLLIERFIQNVDRNFGEIKNTLKEIAQKNIGIGLEKKRAELASFRAGDTAKPIIEALKKSNQPDVIRLALWVEKNWEDFNDAEKDVAYHSFLLPAQRDGDYVHKHELDSPKFWDGIMQSRPDTDLSYKWRGLSMKDVMPYTDLNSEPGKDPNFGAGGAWVDDRGRISPPTVAQLEKLFILK